MLRATVVNGASPSGRGAGDPRPAVVLSAHTLPALSMLDWVILGFTALLALYGYAQGFVVGALSLIGFAVGAFLGTRIAPLLLARRRSLDLRAAVHARRRAAGRRRLRQRPGGVRRTAARTDAPARASAPLTGCLARCSPGAWRSASPGSPGRLRSTAPPPGRCAPTSTARRSCARSTACSRPRSSCSARSRTSTRSPPSTARPPTSAPRRRDPRHRRSPRRAPLSVVKVYGMACGLGIEGSGWVVAPDLIVTNAHVVAGEHDTEIQLRGTGAGDPGDRRRLRRARRPRRPAGASARPPAALHGPEPHRRRAGRHPRLPARRPLPGTRRPPRPDPAGRHPGRLRPGPRDAPDHRPARAS